MTRATRRRLAGLMMITGLVSAGRSAVAASAETPTLGRVRSHNAAIAALIRQAGERSKTFHSLLDTINASDGIVYVEEGTCGNGVRACLVSVTKAGPYRLLSVKVDTRRADCDLMGSIGHELRHTIEVLSDRTVTSSAAMYIFYRFYKSDRSSGGSAFETCAAIETGTAVRAEVSCDSPPRARGGCD